MISKQDKVDLLNEMQAGKKSLADLTPLLELKFVETEKGRWRDFTEGAKYKHVEDKQLEEYVNNVKLINVGKRIVVDYMYFDEYKIIKERLENEYL